MRVFSDYCNFAELRNTQSYSLVYLPAWLTTIKFWMCLNEETWRMY